MLTKYNPFRRSLSTRLLVVFVIASVLLTIMAMITLMHGFANAWQVNARPHLELYLDYISEDIGSPPSEEAALALSKKLPVHIYISGPSSYYSTNGETLELDEVYFDKPGLRHHPRFPHGKKSIADVEFGGNEDKTLLKRELGEYTVYYELSHQGRKTERRKFMLPALSALLASLAILYFIIRRMLLPVADIRKGVQKMGQGNLSHRIIVRRDNDLGTLASSINSMASDIEDMLDSKRQLLLGASHELRSPLTRATIATQLLPESRERQQIEDDLKEMEKLISDILESERMKSGHSILDCERADIQQLVESVLEDMQANNVTLDMPDTLPSVFVDSIRISILIRNLVGNAISHNSLSSEPVSIRATQKNEFIELSISDQGPGIAPEHLEKVTEPFYRVDQSRTRQTGGYGLGLHLAKLIAQAHGGSLTIHSRTDKHGDSEEYNKSSIKESTGTTVVVSLPLN